MEDVLCVMPSMSLHKAMVLRVVSNDSTVGVLSFLRQLRLPWLNCNSDVIYIVILHAYSLYKFNMCERGVCNNSHRFGLIEL